MTHKHLTWIPWHACSSMYGIKVEWLYSPDPDIMTSSECSESEGEQLPLQEKTEEDCFQRKPKEQPAESRGFLSRLLKWKWREAAILACQLVAYMGCNMAYSLMGPFFLEVVSLIHMHACS